MRGVFYFFSRNSRFNRNLCGVGIQFLFYLQRRKLEKSIESTLGRCMFLKEHYHFSILCILVYKAKSQRQHMHPHPPTHPLPPSIHQPIHPPTDRSVQPSTYLMPLLAAPPPPSSPPRPVLSSRSRPPRGQARRPAAPFPVSPSRCKCISPPTSIYTIDPHHTSSTNPPPPSIPPTPTPTHTHTTHSVQLTL